MPKMLDAALEYVKLGFRVFPVKLDKKPFTEHGLKDATETIQGVREFWTKFPNANIGIPTDELVVIDFDLEHGGIESKATLENTFGALPPTRTHITGGGGFHFIYRNPNGRDIRNTTKLAGYDGVDIRANGGYIVMPPSLHKSGNRYQVSDNSPIADCPEWLLSLTQVKTPSYEGDAGEKIPQGQNDQWLYRRASAYRGKGDTEDIIFEKLKVDARRLDQDPTRPYTDKDFKRIARSAMTHRPNPIPPTSSRDLSQSLVTQWLSIVSGSFNTRQLWSELGIITPDDKAHLRMILHRLTEDGVIAKTATDGTYRKLDNEKKILNWENADPNKYLPLKFPFDLHKYCKVFPKSIIIVAGSKNEGKTSFLISCIMPNVSLGMPIDFYVSETGAEQLNERLSPLNIPQPPPFNTYERYDNFADVIEPDHLSIIDYLDFNSEVYLVGNEIDAIFRKLTTGVAIIGLQKPPPTVVYIKGVRKVIDRDLAYGGGFTAKRAIIYISLSSHKLKMIYVKTPLNPKVNPNNMMWSYEFSETGYFTNIQRYYEKEELF